MAAHAPCYGRQTSSSTCCCTVCALALWDGSGCSAALLQQQSETAVLVLLQALQRCSC
jgi:hypothetical protein